VFFLSVVFDICVFEFEVSSSQSTFLHDASNARLSQVERGLASKCQFRRLLLTIVSQAIAISNAHHPHCHRHHHHIIIISSSSSGLSPKPSQFPLLIIIILIFILIVMVIKMTIWSKEEGECLITDSQCFPSLTIWPNMHQVVRVLPEGILATGACHAFEECPDRR